MNNNVVNKDKGFTLTELVVALAVGAILLALAIPPFSIMMKNNRMASTTNAMVAAVNLTRSEAIRRNARVTMCKSADGSDCTTDNAWDQGWIIFVDVNGNAIRDEGEELLRTHDALGRGITVSGSSDMANYLSYSPSGRSVRTNGAFLAGTLALCDDRGDDYARLLVLNRVGRLKLKPGEEDACP